MSAEKKQPIFTCDPIMVERAARGWWAHESDGDVAWSEVTEAVKDGYRARAEVALHAAFEGVPMANYAIGTLLQFFDYVACLKISDPLNATAGVYEADAQGPEHGFDALAHHLNLTFGAKGEVRSITLSKLGQEGDDAR